MTNNSGVSWNKIITVCSVFGIPLVSVCFMGIIWLTRLDDKISSIATNQNEQSYDIKGIKEDLNLLRVKVDTVTQRQKDAQRENDYRFRLQEHDKTHK